MGEIHTSYDPDTTRALTYDELIRLHGQDPAWATAGELALAEKTDANGQEQPTAPSSEVIVLQEASAQAPQE